MLRTEPAETAPVHAPRVAPETSEAFSAPTELISPDKDAPLAELMARVEEGIARNKGRSQRVRKVSSYVTTISFGCAFAFSRGIFPTIGWCLLVTLINIYVDNMIRTLGFSLWAGRSEREERAAAKQLVELDDVRTVGSLIDTLQWTNDRGTRDSALRPELWRALGRLLPRLTEEQAHQLGEERHGLLAAWMKDWDLPFFGIGAHVQTNESLLGMLHVMTYLGQGSIKVLFRSTKSVLLLPVLDRWARGEEAGRDPAVQQAAVACREAIQQKLALARSGKQLLRASCSTADSPEVLLRPALGAEKTDPQELLRPGASDPGSADAKATRAPRADAGRSE
jgi:hypothetical protein